MASAYVFRVQARKNKSRCINPKDEHEFEEAQNYVSESKLLSAEKLMAVDVAAKKPCLFYPSSRLREWWDYFIMVIATWNAFALPVELSLEPEALRTKYNAAANVAIDICFFFDIIIIFRTAIFGATMEIVTDTKAIATNYLKGNFWIDFL